MVAISPDGLKCQARSEQAWGGVRGTVGAFGGRVYFEASVSDEGLCRWVDKGSCWAMSVGCVERRRQRRGAVQVGRLGAMPGNVGDCQRRGAVQWVQSWQWASGWG